VTGVQTCALPIYIAVAFNFSDILNLDNESKALRMGRMMQNVKLCKKFHVSMILATFASKESELRTPRELISFGVSIGMTEADAKKAINQIGKIASR
jgi:RNase P/RNase MRP subunit p30